MKRTFLDAGVLIAAARGENILSQHALVILSDPQRQFISSVFVQLEVIPKAVFNRRPAEAQLYQRFFDNVRHWPKTEEVCSLALEVASESGLAALDALHIAAAALMGADEFITTEGPTKPLFRTKRLKVIELEQAEIS